MPQPTGHSQAAATRAKAVCQSHGQARRGFCRRRIAASVAAQSTSPEFQAAITTTPPIPSVK
jgi:hypothetical protein